MAKGSHQHPQHHQPYEGDKVTTNRLAYYTVVHRRRPGYENADIDGDNHHLRYDVECFGGFLGRHTDKVGEQQKEHGKQHVDGIGLGSLATAHQPLPLHRAIDGKHQTLGDDIGNRKPFKATGQKLLHEPNGDIAEHGAQKQYSMAAGFDFLLTDCIQRNADHRKHIADEVHVVQ